MSRQNQAIPRSIVETAMSRAPRDRTVTPFPGTGVALDKHGSNPAIGGDIPSGHSNPVWVSTAEDKFPHRESSEHPAPDASANWPKCVRLAASHAIAAGLGAALMWQVMEKPDFARYPDEPANLPVKTPIASPSVPSPPASAPPTVTIEAQIRDTLEGWRQSWSSRDIDAYLGFYSTDFIPESGVNRAAWVENRRKKLLSRSHISVRISDIKISRLENGQIKVTLLQDYESGQHQETRRPKTFLLKLENGGWRIVQERQDSQ